MIQSASSNHEVVYPDRVLRRGRRCRLFSGLRRRKTVDATTITLVQRQQI